MPTLAKVHLLGIAPLIRHRPATRRRGRPSGGRNLTWEEAVVIRLAYWEAPPTDRKLFQHYAATSFGVQPIVISLLIRGLSYHTNDQRVRCSHREYLDAVACAARHVDEAAKRQPELREYARVFVRAWVWPEVCYAE